mmetsp:Transcript_30688/g.57186  ORF Transcript_30688/g.57186 Transcript_30688/m.57186 type:complete len:398 (-) Transcript_30688:935-2128(-)
MSNAQIQNDLFSAVAKGNVEDVHKAILEGAQVCVSDEDGNTVTHVAARHRHLPVMEVLHELGVDLNAQNNDGWSPVYMAACGDNGDEDQFVKAIAELGADVNLTSISGWSPMLIATQKCHIRTVKTLIEAGADVDMANNGGLKPVYLSACLGYWDICALLVNAGADIFPLTGIPLIPPNSVRDILILFEIDLSLEEDPVMVAKCQVLSIVKLLSSVSQDSDNCVDDDGVNSLVSDPNELQQFELALMAAFESLRCLSTNPIDAIRRIIYPMRRKLSKCAWRLHCQSRLGGKFDGDRGNDIFSISRFRNGELLTMATRQYAELLSLFADQTMLTDLLALRLTCQSNNYRQRFPVTCLRSYHELEVNLIESFIAGDASRLVPTGLVNSLLTLFSGEVEI